MDCQFMHEETLKRDKSLQFIFQPIQQSIHNLNAGARVTAAKEKCYLSNIKRDNSNKSSKAN